MLKKKITSEEPIRVTVGDVIFHVTKIGPQSFSLGVDAPRDMHIEIDAGGLAQDTPVSKRTRLR